MKPAANAPAAAVALQFLRALFPQISVEAAKRLVQAARFTQHPAEVTLCQEGGIEHCLYLIIDGRADVIKHLEGQRLFINQLGPGSHFGDVALLLDMPRTASIVTSEPTELLEIDRPILGELLRTNPEFVLALSQMVLRRFLAQEEKQLMEIARLKKRDAPPARVFVSYARADQGFVSRLSTSLLKQQIDVWLDVYRLEPGKSWARQIGEALDACQMMLLVLSPASVASENVEDEWNYYLDQKKPIIAVLHERCKIPYRLSKLHFIDFRDTDYDQAVARVVATFNTQ
jgi:CRP-like cAMP-binding protein